VQRHRCVILEHRHRGGRHFDWLFEHPDWPRGLHAPLWAGRVERGPGAWSEHERLTVVPLPPHRRVYLDRQGVLTGGRGRVRRVASGWVRPILWRPGRIDLAIDLSIWCGRATLRPLHRALWLAQLTAAPGA
jgi:hypothetical protein